MLEEPLDELTEVYAEVQELEADFKKTLGMCQHLLSHSRDLFNSNQEYAADLDHLRHEHQLMVNQDTIHQSAIQQSEIQYEKNQLQQNEADATIKILKQEINDKDEEITGYTNKILELNAEIEEFNKSKND